MKNTPHTPHYATSTQNQEVPFEIAEALERIIEMSRQIETANVKCGVIGRSGAGKSSLINAIAGERIAKVGVIEQTMEAQEFHHGGLTFVDLPGCGTLKWQRDTYIDRLGLEDYDCFLLVTADRFFEDDVYLYEKLSVEAGRPTFVVRTKMDLAIEAGKHDNGLSPDEVDAKIRSNIMENLGAHPPERCYLVSARKPGQFDLPVLLDDMMRALDGVKQKRFAADAASYSEALLDAKREAAELVVRGAAATAFLNGFNPVPVLDITADLGILQGLSHKVLHIYGLTEKQLEYTQTLFDEENAAFKATVIAASRLGADLLQRKGIEQLLKRLGKHAASRYAAKWVPVIGSVISGSVGASMTYYFGMEAIDRAAEVANDILQKVAEPVAPNESKGDDKHGRARTSSTRGRNTRKPADAAPLRTLVTVLTKVAPALAPGLGGVLLALTRS